MAFLPSNLNNQYKGLKIVDYGLYPIFAIYIFRSLVHFLADNSGLVGIATIKEFPIFEGLDPNNIIYLFASLWGATQVSLTVILLILFIKYKNLIPLIYLICLMDQCFRLISGYLHPLGEQYYINTPPGVISNIPILIYLIVMFFLSLKRRSQYD
ncbi:MAG: hypothetical protein ACJ0FB_02805 [Gammaproteobacteria bacterium]|jgi:hypothetical protein|tara:strand:- start:4792 stop:5256 length:465 start_codon:yes stop_codon:yes gene_type:complete